MGKYADKLLSTEEALSFDDVLLLPGKSIVNLADIDISTRLTRRVKLEIPIVSSPMDTVTEEEMAIAMAEMGGIGVLHRNMNEERALKAIKRIKELGLKVAAAIGHKDRERAAKYYSAGADALLIDAAHGHHINIVKATRWVKQQLGAEVISGNVATPEAAEALIEAGADALRVGIGGGHACTTREIAGVGVPQLTAIAWVADVASEYGVPVIADGAIEKPADVVKALAAGGDTVMLGYLLAGTKEAPGAIVYMDGKKYKAYRGMGSPSALKAGSQRYGEFKRAPEGVEGLVEYRGSVRGVVEWLVNGLKQGMGYVGASNLEELRNKARFVRLSPAGYWESRPRGFRIER